MRTLHPFAWWAWGISLAIAASQVRSIWLTVIIILASLVVAFARKTQDPWAAALIIGMKIALVALILRMVIAVLFSVPGQGTVLFSIPRIQLPEWLAGIFLGGAVTVERLRFVLFESLTIFALVITVAAASSLANPKQTLRSLPGVLHEAGVALIIATTLIQDRPPLAARELARQLLSINSTPYGSTTSSRHTQRSHKVAKFNQVL